ncbi:MAG TPA: N(4)-(beta-N-acetylglucosaminyl)-L-asparaginase [Blastocatellia bacterium]|nr:N(4)-(beta-N-acetylglucosaminyl)-L-asparaginase [Blastocatellia bacterium]
MSSVSRREFVKSSAAAIVAAQPQRNTGSVTPLPAPVVIASTNGLRAVERAYQLLKEEKVDTLEAVLSGVNIIEDDPEDNTVGFGGLPNEDGVVELDSSVMHGPSRRSGAVAGLREIRNPSRVAQTLMKRTDHSLLVGEGALRFALAHGFKRQDLLTEKSRIAWLAWKESLSDKDSWGPGLSSPDETPDQERRLRSYLKEVARPDLEEWILGVVRNPPTGTITCLALNEKGEMSGSTSTSGLAWKLAGRVGDSALIGCGLFVDQEVGAAGSTGRGEEAIRIAGTHTVVEAMRRGAAPKDACLEALKRVAASYPNRMDKLSKFNVMFYALNRKGQHAAAALWNEAFRVDRMTKSQYAVADAQGIRLVDAAYLFERK